MKRYNAYRKAVRLLMVSTFMGTMFQAGCLDRMAGIGQRVGKNFNPCGTILNCDPVEWDLMFHDFPDWSIDPTCTIPGLCGDQWPPTSDSGNGGNNNQNQNQNQNLNNLLF